LEFRKPLSTSSALLGVLEVVRAEVPPLQNDRFLAPDLEKATILIRNGKLIKVADKAKFPNIEGA
jgi:histidine ammonia-lyase